MSDPSFLGRGWSFPPAFTTGGGDVETVAGAEDIKQSLRILLDTVPGERIMQDAFGCHLPSLVYEELDQALVNTIERFVSDAILAYEPRVVLDKLDVAASGKDAGVVLIGIFYTVRATNARYNMVYPFYLTEATLLPGV